MNPFSILLDGARARDTLVLRTIQNPPWSVQVRDRAPLNRVAVLRGTPWVVPSAGEAVRLDAGDIAMMRGPDAFTFTDDPRTPVQVVVQPGPRRTTAAGAALPEAPDMGGAPGSTASEPITTARTRRRRRTPGNRHAARLERQGPQPVRPGHRVDPGWTLHFPGAAA
ncbi:cupin domain-containing protein [Nonomuraea sp. NPDC050643]|uniref:cupin domain-containing protein n=1 Tax=Nonomuraea sp. NPDC050643 TaxID=3155660 RepID=UPI0033C7BC9B